jgi:hypothetical protein
VNITFANNILNCLITYLGRSLNEIFAHQWSSTSGTACPLKKGRESCPETSVINCQSTLRNITEDRRSLLNFWVAKHNIIIIIIKIIIIINIIASPRFPAVQSSLYLNYNDRY